MLRSGMKCWRRSYSVAVTTVKEISELSGPKCLPVVGSFWYYAPYVGEGKKPLNIVNVIKKMHEDYGKVVGFRRNPEKISVMIIDPKHIEIAFKAEGKNVQRTEFTPYYMMQKRKGMNFSIAVDNSERWRKLRSFANPIVVKPKSIQDYLPIHNEVCNELMEVIDEEMEKNKIVIGMENHLRKFALEAVSIIAVDKKLNSFKNDGSKDKNLEEFIKVIIEIFKDSSTLLFSFPFYTVFPFLSPTFTNYEKNSHRLLEIVHEWIKEAEELSKGKDKKEQKTMLEMMLESYKDAGLEHEDVVGLASDLLGAGVDTTSISLQWLLIYLAKYPQIQQEVIEEIDEKVGTNPKTQITTRHINACKKLRAFVKETLRVQPLVTGTGRFLDKEIILDNFRIPRGTLVQMNGAVSLLNEDYVDNPDKFDINRWMRGSRETAPDPFAFLQFGYGARSCLGRRIAEQEIHLLLVKLLQRYRVSYPKSETDGWPIPISSLFITPDRSLDFQLIQR
ncbi:hypothetical protein SNEBB_011200 [Seison nebaliae]|nr:hypothetical protein SNEBB_011200 [Seison nebaliae]